MVSHYVITIACNKKIKNKQTYSKSWFMLKVSRSFFTLVVVSKMITLILKMSAVYGYKLRTKYSWLSYCTDFESLYHDFATDAYLNIQSVKFTSGKPRYILHYFGKVTIWQNVTLHSIPLLLIKTETKSVLSETGCVGSLP